MVVLQIPRYAVPLTVIVLSNEMNVLFLSEMRVIGIEAVPFDD